MGVATITSGIQTVLLGVSGVSIVHKYERWAKDWTTFLGFFKTSGGKINGWMISRKKTPSRVADIVRYNQREHEFRLFGIYGLDDSAASELTFQAQVEAVQNALDAAMNPSDAHYKLDWTCEKCGPGQVEVVENRVFGTVLCHVAEIILPVTERVTRS